MLPLTDSLKLFLNDYQLNYPTLEYITKRVANNVTILS